MTTIVGVADETGAWLGADSAVVEGASTFLPPDTEKVFECGPLVIANTGSVRVRNLLRYTFQPPRPHADVDPMAYLVSDVIPLFRELLKNGGVEAWDGAELVAFRGKLYSIDMDFSVSSAGTLGYLARGSGGDIALGALCASVGSSLSAGERIMSALGTAAKHDCFTRAPFTLLHQPHVTGL